MGRKGVERPDRPLCSCHGIPMHDSASRGKQYWVCAVKRSEYRRKHYELNREKTLETNRAWYRKNRKRRLAADLKWRKNNPEAATKITQRANQRRRARRLGALVGPSWGRNDLLLAYGNLCHLCDKIIDLSLQWPNPEAFSEDHVIPLARGGTHSFDNVRPAHLSCNWIKGARV